MAETSDVVVVGGGAAGCAVAYYLALAGVKATIVEQEGVATQASGFSAGGLNPLQGTGIPGPLGPLAGESPSYLSGIIPRSSACFCFPEGALSSFSGSRSSSKRAVGPAACRVREPGAPRR